MMEFNRGVLFANIGKECPYSVIIVDNFHYMKEKIAAPQDGEFKTLEEAVHSCERLVDAELIEAYTPGISAKEVYQAYVMFGDDPYVVGPNRTGVPFSGRTYSKKRCNDIRGEGGETGR